MKSIAIRMLICLIVFAGSDKISAQSADPNVSNYTQIVDILPPSPNAASIGKYGGLNTNLSSGMINSGIPIFEYKSTNIVVPIALRYSSNGTRIDEIAGRVGTGWSLEAGGVITRTVMGRPDDKATRTIPSGFSSRSDINLVDALCVGTGGTADAQPDLFSFNFGGNSGKFMLDSSFNPILLTHSGLKIESAFDGNGNLTFKFTTVDGVQYCFDSDSAMETTEKYQTDCGHRVPQFLVTAWYLSRIIHPNHDTVSFVYSPTGSNYKVGISESIFQYNSQYTPPACAGFDNIPIPSVQNTTCLTWLLTSGEHLTEIHSTGGASVQFSYTQRIDITDPLLTGIKIYQPGADSPCRVFTLQYQQFKATSFTNSYSDDDSSLQYRPFLTAFSEQSPDGMLTKNYSFTYNDPGGLAPRLSYAQDDYGLFNGKNNHTMIPKPTDLIWSKALLLATADRSSDVFYASKGMLTKIVYPTGGQDSIVYESNTVYTNQPIYKPAIVEAAILDKTTTLGPPVTDTSAVFHVYFDQQTEIIGSCQLDPGQSEDVIHDKATISLSDKTSGSQVFSQSLTTDAGNNQADQIFQLVGGHDYQLQVTVSGTGVRGAADLQFIPDTPITNWVNAPVGGVRVQKLITQSDPLATPIIKHFFYNRPGATASSASFIQQPTYQKALFAYASCGSGDCHCTNPGTSCEYTNFYYYSMYSNSLNTIYLYSGTPVCYSNVFESSGDNFENGGIRHDCKSSAKSVL